jgi:uncharacterized membrane protein
MFVISIIQISSFSHQTPKQRIVTTKTLSKGDSLFESRSISKGKLILFRFNSPHSVLSLLNHFNFSIYLGLYNDSSLPPIWYQLPSVTNGFYVFGPSQAIIEVVASNDMELTYACRFLSNFSKDCTEILSGSSLLYQFRNFLGYSSRLCFLPTDYSVSARISGTIGCSIEITGGKVKTFYKNKPELFDNFQSIDVIGGGGGDEEMNVDIQFSGGKIEYDYDRVTIDSKAGVVSKSGFSEYELLTKEPDYPEMDSQFGMTLVWILFVVVTLLILIIGSITTMYRMWVNSKERRSAEEDQLHDQQREISPEGESDDERVSEEVSLSHEEIEQTDEFPESPYERKGREL